MFLRLLFESFRRQKRRKTVALLAIALGMSIATAMIAVGTDIGDKINQELRSLGANLVITPMEDTLDVNIGGVNLKPASEGAFIAEQDLIKIKSIFWEHNIKGYAPFLSAPQTIKTTTKPRRHQRRTDRDIFRPAAALRQTGILPPACVA